MSVDRGLSIVGAAAETLADGWSSYLEVVEHLLSTTIGGDLVVWNGIDLTTGKLEVCGSACDAWRWLMPALEDTAADNPLLLHFVQASGWVGPTRMSDIAPDVREFRRGRLYNELWRPMGAKFQIGVTTVASTTGASRGWAMNRSHRDFTDSDLDLLSGLQRALAALEDLSMDSRTATAETRDSTTSVAVEEAGAGAGRDELDRDLRLKDDSGRGTTLTPREQEVLELVAAGWTAVHVAHALRISAATVRKHLEHIYDKLDRHDRLLAVRRARALGLLPP